MVGPLLGLKGDEDSGDADVMAMMVVSMLMMMMTKMMATITMARMIVRTGMMTATRTTRDFAF